MPSNYSRPTPAQIDDLLQQAHDLRLENTRRSLELGRQAQALALQIDYQKGLAYSLYINCLCHFILADKSDLLEQAYQVLSLFEGLANRAGAAQAHNLLALIYKRRGQFEEALAQYKLSLEIRRRLDDRIGQSGTLNNIALVYQLQSKKAEALDYLFQALRLVESSGDAHGNSYALTNIASVYFETGEHARALEFAQQALEFNHQTNDRALESTLLTLLSKIHRTLGKHDTAVECLQRGLEISRGTGNLNDEGDALLELGLIYQDLHQTTHSEESLKAALQIMQRLGSRHHEAEVLQALGTNFLQQENFPAALDCFQQALQAAQDSKSDQRLIDIHPLLVKTYEALGDYRMALEHFRIFHQAQAHVHKLGQERRIHELTSEWESQHAHSEAALRQMQSTELSQALQALRDADEQKASLLNRLKKQAELLEQLAHEDGMTGLANRRWLDIKLAQEFERSRRFGHALTVAMIDLDDFKQVNDRFAHQTGDAVLIKAAALMREHFRSVDVIGRYGGEEFMLILVETTLDQAKATCDRLCRRVSDFNWTSVHPGLDQVTLSIGLAGTAAEDHAIGSPEQLIGLADEQLYRAKRGGKNQVCA